MSQICHFPFTGEPFRIQMGLLPLDLKDWLEIGQDFAAQTQLKARLLTERPDEVLIVNAEAHGACLELNQLVQEHLLHHFPGDFRRQGQSFVNRNGVLFQPAQDGREALEQLGHWIQEDFALVSPAPAHLSAALVAFPSRWRLADKMGKAALGIHEPVPGFTTIATSSQRFLDQLHVDKPMWRINWTIHDSDNLFSPGLMPHTDDMTPFNVLDKTFLRLERQTLRRLPSSQFGAFSIRTYVYRMQEVMADPIRAELVKKTLVSLPVEVANYKGMRHFFKTLLTAL